MCEEEWAGNFSLIGGANGRKYPYEIINKKIDRKEVEIRKVYQEVKASLHISHESVTIVTGSKSWQKS